VSTQVFVVNAADHQEEVLLLLMHSGELNPKDEPWAWRW